MDNDSRHMLMQEGLAGWYLIWFIKSESRAWLLGQMKPYSKTGWGWQGTAEKAPGEDETLQQKRLGSNWSSREGPRSTRVAARQQYPWAAKKSPQHSGLHELGCCQKVRGEILPCWSGALRQTWVLCPVLSSPTCERHQCIGASPTEASEVAGAGAQSIQGQAAGVGLFQS